jgi:preprotein translocase subunit SecF
MEIFRDTNYDFLGKKWPFIIASLVLTAAGLVSIALKGGLKYGIDFRGGVQVDVVCQTAPPVNQIRDALSRRIPGEIEVQSVGGARHGLLIGTELKGERELADARQNITETLGATMGQPGSGKLDFSNAGAQALADRLRDPLLRNGVGLSEPQLQELAQSMVGFRDRNRSGLLNSFDELASAPYVSATVINTLKQECYLAPFHVRSVQSVGPKVGAELRTQAVLATLYALAGMLIYIAFRFEWIYGVAAVIAVFHDTIITIGLFSIFNKEITLTVIAALLTLVGYSMNDTIVVFDRIRENLKILRREKLEPLINKSVNQTLSRTALTNGLTFLTVLALFFFGGQVLNGFAFALVVGFVVGTYSSVFIASALVVFWNDYLERRKRRSGAPSATPAPAAGKGGAVKAVK